MQVSSISSPRHNEDADYASLLGSLRGLTAWPLFTTDATGLYDVFLGALPVERRKHYECRACRRFVDSFGGVVVIDDKGSATSPIWNGWAKSAAFFNAATDAVFRVVDKARVNGVLLSSEPQWGLPKNVSPKSPSGEWLHMHVAPSPEMRYRASAVKNASQAMAEKLEDRGMLCRGLTEFPIELVRQAHTLLTTGALYRSDKCIGVAKWLLDLHEALAGTKHKVARENLIWRAVALAPTGFCHIRTTMISTLLEDLVSGKPFEDIKRSFDAKMSPILYQRPQAAPTDGQLAAAEAVVSKLASSGSLARRFARLEEALPHAIWAPKAPKPEEPSGSVFGHLKTKGRSPDPIDVPAQPMTWDKFSWTVLPKAERVELLVPHSNAPFFAFVTAENPDAPPILQWDSEEKRNPVSWYLYHNGSIASAWGLSAGSFVEVDAITLQPSGWAGELAHQGDGAYAILRGARDLNSERAGIGLFPEILKSDYRAIRAAMEAYSRSQVIGGKETASACGLALQKSTPHWGQTFRVTSAGARVLYRLDRWD